MADLADLARLVRARPPARDAPLLGAAALASESLPADPAAWMRPRVGTAEPATD